MQFTDLDLAKPILKALAQEGYDEPTPIQQEAIPPALEGLDVLGCAQTGTGKTAAFCLPILNRLAAAGTNKNRRGLERPRALVLSPTRELATQIADGFKAYGRNLHVRGCVIFGGVSQFHQVRQLKRGVDVIVATPGRLIDLLDQGLVDLSEIETFVLDEADRMLDMGFIHPIRRIAAELPEDRQTLLFSATMPPKIADLARSLMIDPVMVEVTPVASAAPLIEQSLYMAPQDKKINLLLELLDNPEITRALVFTRTKHGADRLSKTLSRDGVRSDAIHGNKSQSQRQRALEAFRSGRARVLVATDVAARGIDVDEVSHVFNFHLPNEPEAYVHRIGRTGRAGATGKAISFCAPDERGYLRDIERLTGERLASADGSERPADSRAARGKPRHKKKQGGKPGQKPGSKAGAKAKHPGGAKPKGRGKPSGKKAGQKAGKRPGGKPAHRGKRPAPRA